MKIVKYFILPLLFISSTHLNSMKVQLSANSKELTQVKSIKKVIELYKQALCKLRAESITQKPTDEDDEWFQQIICSKKLAPVYIAMTNYGCTELRQNQQIDVDEIILLDKTKLKDNNFVELTSLVYEDEISLGNTVHTETFNLLIESINNMMNNTSTGWNSPDPRRQQLLNPKLVENRQNYVCYTKTVDNADIDALLHSIFKFFNLKISISRSCKNRLTGFANYYEDKDVIQVWIKTEHLEQVQQYFPFFKL